MEQEFLGFIIGIALIATGALLTIVELYFRGELPGVIDWWEERMSEK